MRTALLALAALLALIPAAPAHAASAAPPTAAQLKAAVAACTKQVSNGKYAHDAGGARTVPVCATRSAVHWRADLDIDCDGQRTAKCNPSTDPYWQNATAFPQSDGKPLNAETLPFIVLPLASSTWNYRNSGITGGTVAAAVYRDKVVYGVVGDLGPSAIIGEASYRMAQLLGINPHPSTGGVSGAVVDFVVFPGVKSVPIQNNATAVRLGQQAAAALVS
ncbi:MULTISPECIES: glycoside hydrolase family 75 protein [unclassified Crossiella]|uniref:glycoside hydrolase family 75 protein n=1 Tax=unclassified Crossiella TaxID=2620835 RepID=UPI002493FFF9|nr:MULTISPECIES: glycoside hydrolase family 75 protein [unclassified Crossiella]